MRHLLLSATLALTLASCSALTTLATVDQVPPRPASVTPLPPLVIQHPTLPLVSLDEHLVTVILAGPTLTIRLTDPAGSVWLRVLGADGAVSPATRSPGCGCLGLGATLGSLALQWGPGLRIETATTPDGPWTLAATTQ
jgi:hypothetical protein